MTINGNKSNPLTVTVTEIPVTEINIQLMSSWLTIRPLTSYYLCRYVENRVLVDYKVFTNNELLRSVQR